MRRFIGGFAAIVFAAAVQAAPVPKQAEIPPPPASFKRITDPKMLPPQELMDTYEAFVARAKKDGEVEKFCLELSVRIVAERPAKTAEFGDDLSKAFLQKGFEAEVLSARKVNDECYMIRTATSSLWFVQTKAGEWKLYRYADRMVGC